MSGKVLECYCLLEDDGNIIPAFTCKKHYKKKRPGSGLKDTPELKMSAIIKGIPKKEE